jgi:RNA polymerase sigma-70 factor, ECF subfamily
MDRAMQANQDSAGEALAVEALALFRDLHRTAYRLTGNPADADDLVQETYLRLVRFAHSFTPGTNLKGWMFTILRNTARNAWRDAARDPVTADSDAVERAPSTGGTTANPEAQLLRREAAREVQAALELLPAGMCEAIRLRDIEDHSYREIAASLAVPMGTVMSRISRGRRLLRHHGRVRACARVAD